MQCATCYLRSHQFDFIIQRPSVHQRRLPSNLSCAFIHCLTEKEKKKNRIVNEEERERE